MKTLGIILVLAVCSNIVSAQQSKSFGSNTSDKLENPEFIGEPQPNWTYPGEEVKTLTLHEYLQQSIEYPARAERNMIEGRVVVSFFIMPDGQVDQIKVENSVDDQCDRNVVRAIKNSSGMWAPGKVDGEETAMRKEITVAFHIDGNNTLNESSRYYTSKGNKKLVKGDFEKAIENYNKALVYAPRYELCYYHRGLAKYKSGDLLGALNDFHEVNLLGSTLADNLIPKLEKQYASGE